MDQIPGYGTDLPWQWSVLLNALVFHLNKTYDENVLTGASKAF